MKKAVQRKAWESVLLGLQRPESPATTGNLNWRPTSPATFQGLIVLWLLLVCSV